MRLTFRLFAAVIAVAFSHALSAPAFSDSMSVDLGSFEVGLIESKQTTAAFVGRPRRAIERVTAPGFSSYNSSGNPALPCRVIYVALPPDADESSVCALPGSYSTAQIPGEFDISPVPAAATAKGIEDWGHGKRISAGRNQLVYRKNAFYPEEHVRVRCVGHLRTWKIAEVEFWPYCYNPVSGRLRAVTSGKAALSFEKLAGACAAVSDPVAAEMAGFVSNSAEAASFYPPFLGDQPASAADYVIITTSAIATQSAKLSEFAAFQAGRGFTARIVTEAEWGGETGDTAANNIRDWLKANYLTLGIKYALLIGRPHPSDGDVPMKMLWPRKGLSYPEAPSDYFYSDLTGDWDIDGDGSYGEDPDDFDTGGIDRIPDVNVGRIPYYGSISDLNHILQKTMDYESGVLGSWSRTFLLPMKPLDVDPPQTLSYQLGEEIKRDVITPSNLVADRIYDNSYGLNPPPEHIPCDYATVSAQWRLGAGFVFWMTHGAPTYAAGVIASDMCPLLDDTKPAIVYSASCDNGYPEDSNNLGYALLRSGAVSTQTASRASWYFTGETTYTNAGTIGGLGYQYAKYLINYAEPCARAAMDGRLAAPMTIWANQVVYNIYGDPSLAYNASAFGAIAGRVLTTSGQPILGASIRSTDGRKSAHSASDGSYMLDGMGVSAMDLIVSAGGYYSQRFYGLPVTMGGVMSMDFQMVPVVYGAISGHVYDERGAPIPGASIAASGSNRATSSLADGSYLLPCMEPGAYTIVVSKSPYAQKSVPVTVSENQVSDVDVTLRMQTGNAVLNGGFEAGFDPDFAGLNWDWYYSSGYLAFPGKEEYWRTSGKFSQRLTTPTPSVDNAHAGFYQIVTVLPGGSYALSARERCDTSNNIVCRLGYDLAGGIDYSSSNIVWSAFASQPNSWHEITVPSITPTSSKMTIFLDAWRDQPNVGQSCKVWFDDVTLDGIVDSPGAPLVTLDSRYQSSASTIHAAWSCPGSDIVGYDCAVSATFEESGIVPGGGWQSLGAVNSITRSGLALSNGDTVRVLVRARDSRGIVGEIGASEPVRIVTDVPDIASAKLMTDGAWVRVSSARTSRMGSGPERFIEDSNRVSGIKAAGSWVSIPYVKPGMSVTVAGRLDSQGDLRVLADAELMPSTMGVAPNPFGLANSLVGGGGYHYLQGPPASGQKGTPWGSGVNNVGLLAAVWGRVIFVGSDTFTISDGTLPGGLTISCFGSAAPPAQDAFVRVVGIVTPGGVSVYDSADISPQ